ncbi:sensor domain-containing protein [Azohydromonas lata]|uniref:sensor domain-containing protein n=1 Tax=Azohydromonas lata TaxID=45677 RepID=UPI0009FF663F|nr:bifunctional diguanylate cyclase/phosphodiesterase [Azohydromonas lata]
MTLLLQDSCCPPAANTDAALRRLADEITVLVWVIDEHGVITQLNRQARVYFERPSQFSFSAWRRFIHPEDKPRVRAALASATAAREDYQIRYRLVRSDGSLRWMKGVGAPCFDAQGRYCGYAGTITDVSASHALREQLTRSEAEYRLLAENASDLITRHDAAGRYVYVAPACEHLLGYTQAELLGRNANELIHPQDVGAVRAEVEAQLAHGRHPAQIELRLRHRDGHYVWLATATRAMADPDTGALSGTVAVSRDISVEKAMREQLQVREERYRSLASLLSDCYWETDAQGRFTVMGPEASSWLGMDVGCLLGKTRLDLAADPADPGLQEYLRRFAQRQPFRDLCYGVRSQHDQEPYYMSIAGEPMVRDGSFVGYRGMSRNVTEQRRIEQRLQALSDENRNLIDNSLDMVCTLDAEGRFLRINPAGCRITGYAAQELLGQRWHQFVHPQDREHALRVDRNAFGDGHDELHDFEIRWGTKDGSEVCLAWSAKWVSAQQMLYVTARDITLRKQAEQRLRRLATSDMLTALPNRARLYEHTDHMLGLVPKDRDSLAVMFIDLDRFKEVNDSMGHEAGDLLLQQVARRLRLRLRPNDMVARLGGDEFVVVLPCDHGADSAAAVARKLLEQFDEPMLLGGQEVFVGASIGIALYPRDGQTKEALFQSADSAMYRAKSGTGGRGSGNYRFFTPEMHEQARARLTLESALRRALERRELELHYQPRLDVATLQVVGMEALLRWNHPQLGSVPPATFIPLAEDTGLINAMGAWVLRQACRQNQLWVQTLGRPLKVSVNLSPRQLHDPQLVADVQLALREAGMAPALLELELTESSLMQDPQAAALTLQRLKALGLELSVDDFGTGHSSLSYLWRFPVDVLKLDRTFLPRLTSSVECGQAGKLAPAIVHLAHTLNLRVVAEGVETREVFDFLRDAGCDEVQGYFFCKPVRPAEFERYLRSGMAAAPGAGS